MQSLLMHPGWEKYQEYLREFLNFYNLAIIYGKKDDREEYIGKAKVLNELIGLSQSIKDYLNSKNKGAK